MSIDIPDQTLASAHMTASELLIEIACMLYEKKKLSIGQARHLASVDLISFQKALAARNIYIHYNMSDLETDLTNIHAAP